jgi:hypothetical protein
MKMPVRTRPGIFARRSADWSERRREQSNSRGGARVSRLRVADNYLREAALPDDPPSKTLSDPERDGIRCRTVNRCEGIAWNGGCIRKSANDMKFWLRSG